MIKKTTIIKSLQHLGFAWVFGLNLSAADTEIDFSKDLSPVPYAAVGGADYYRGDNWSTETGVGTVYFHVLDQEGQRTPVSTTTLVSGAKTYFITHGFTDGVGDKWLFPDRLFEDIPDYGKQILLDDRVITNNFKVSEDDLIDWQAYSPVQHQVAMSILFYHKSKGETVNVVIVDWGDFSVAASDGLRAYTNAAKLRVPRVGRAIADFLLLRNINPSTVTLIGHSLGAHASGFAGQEVQRDAWGAGVKISTIIGMDAAGPHLPLGLGNFQFTFEKAPPQYRLSAGDADKVFDIHTSRYWGNMYPLAQYDLYVNAAITFTGPDDPSEAGDWDVSYEHFIEDAWVENDMADHSYSRCVLSNLFIEAIRREAGVLPEFLTARNDYLDGEGQHITTYKFYAENNFNVLFEPAQSGFRSQNEKLRTAGETDLTIDTFLLGHNPGGFFEDYDPRFYWDPNVVATADLGRSDLKPDFPESSTAPPEFSDFVKFWDDFENKPTGRANSQIVNYTAEHSPDFANKRYTVVGNYPLRIISTAPARDDYEEWFSVRPYLYSGYAVKVISPVGSENIVVEANVPTGYHFKAWNTEPHRRLDGRGFFQALHDSSKPWYYLNQSTFGFKSPKLMITAHVDVSYELDILDNIDHLESNEFRIGYSLTFDPGSDPNGDYDGDGILNKDDVYPKFNHLKATIKEKESPGHNVALDSDYPKINPAYPVNDPRRPLEVEIPNSIPESLVLASRAAKNPTVENRAALAMSATAEEDPLIAITGIADQGLANLNGLQSVTLGKYIETIGDRAFEGSGDLSEIVFTGKEAPEVGADIFSSLTNTAIYVPADSTGYGNEGDLFAGLPVIFESLESFQNGEIVQGLLAVLNSGETVVDMEVFSRMVSALLVDVAEDFDIPAAVINPAMIESLANEYLAEFSEEFGPTLSTIRTSLIELDEIIQLSRTNLKTAGDFLAQLEDYFGIVERVADGEFDHYGSEILADLRVQFEIWKQSYAGHFYSLEFQEDFLAYLEQVSFDLAMEFIMPDIQLALRQRVQDLRASIQNQIDSVFALVEQAIRDKLTDLVAGLNLGEIDASFLSPLDEVCAYGELNGHAQFLGDRIDLLRLDAKFEMKAPDKLSFAGYLEIKCLNSQGNGGCVYEGADFHEFTIGALDVPVGFLGGDVGMNIETSFTFADSGFPLRGLAGKFEMSRGTLEFETFKILSMGAAAAFGEFENYLACEAALQLNQYRVAGGLFFGRTCTIDPLAIAHEQTAQLLWDGSGGVFTGALVYGFASIPISEALGIPASCMFYVSAGIGGGVFFSIDGPTFGGIMELDVGGEALCAVGVNGNVSLVGMMVGNDMRFSGRGHIGGKVGKCPFCLKFGKTVGIEYAQEKWKLSL